MSKINKGDIENFIEVEKEKVWDTYLAIDIKQKQGDVEIPESFIKDLNETNDYQAIKKLLEENTDPEVYFTDDNLDFSESRIIYYILSCAIGKGTLIHVRVKRELVDKVKEDLYEKAEALADDILFTMQWRHSRKDFVVDLTKRNTRWNSYHIRVCDDGSAVAMYLGLKKYKIDYFTLKEALTADIISKAKSKIDEIYNNPAHFGEDDRCWLMVHLTYGLYWQYPDADKKLKKHQKFDDTEYSDDVNMIKLAKQLLNAPEVKKVMGRLQEFVETEGDI